MNFQHKGTFESKRVNNIYEYGVYGKTVKHRLYAGDKKERYFHLYHSISKESAERAGIENRLYSIRITVNSIRNDETTRNEPGNGGKPRKIKGFSELMKRGGARIDKFFEKRAHFSEQKEKLSTLSTKRAGKLHKQRVPGSFLNWNE